MNDQAPLNRSDAGYAYPPIETRMAEHVEVGDGHRLWVERSGADRGIPVVALHGGPGVPFDEADRRLFDPLRLTLFQFDQRGVGRSTPHAKVYANSLWHTVADLELLRERYGVERWVVTGHSFGTTIALAYAQRFPHRCAGLLLRGLYLSTEEEKQWSTIGWATMWPEAWAKAVAEVSPGEPDLYYERLEQQLEGADAEVRLRAATAFSRYELSCCYADPSNEDLEAQLDPASCLANALIAMHFGRHNDFLEPDQLLRDLQQLRAIPTIVVNGRNDVVTPPAPAWRLKGLWPELDLRFAPLSGHMTTEPGNIVAVTRAANDLAALIVPQSCWSDER